MSKIKKGIYFLLSYLGIYPKQFFTNIQFLGGYITDLFKFKDQFKKQYPDWKFKYYPILMDKSDQSGKARGQYFYQDLFVANKIFEARPNKHVDIGSRIDGFVAHVASFRHIEVFDIRPLENHILNVSFIQADLMNPIESLRECTDSLSCLHTIEHFGLGRYGDPLDHNGHLKGLESMYLLLKKGGIFYFSTQIGPNTLSFNAHRIFSVQYLLDLFMPKYEVLSFSYIDDKDGFYADVPLDTQKIMNNYGCKMGCGIFILKKK